MTIRTRLTIWYGCVLFCAIAVIGVLSWSELQERRQRIHRTDHGEVEILEIMLGIGAPAAILSVAGGWWLMRKSLAPLAALTAAAERINENTLTGQLPRSRNGDELDRLTDVFNGMTTRLNDSFQRIREFTLHASHELKTPLTVLCGEMELALRGEALSESARERCASQLEELRRLSRIVDALTLLARADAGLFDLEFAPVELNEIAQDNFADAQILARAQEIHVELAVCEKARIMGNKHRLRQLISKFDGQRSQIQRTRRPHHNDPASDGTCCGIYSREHGTGNHAGSVAAGVRSLFSRRSRPQQHRGRIWAWSEHCPVDRDGPRWNHTN